MFSASISAHLVSFRFCSTSISCLYEALVSLFNHSVNISLFMALISSLFFSITLSASPGIPSFKPTAYQSSNGRLWIFCNCGLSEVDDASHDYCTAWSMKIKALRLACVNWYKTRPCRSLPFLLHNPITCRELYVPVKGWWG